MERVGALTKDAEGVLGGQTPPTVGNAHNVKRRGSVIYAL